MTTLKDRLPATIRTERLVLTAPTMAHAPEIARLANNKNVHKWMARLPFPYEQKDAEFFIQHVVPSKEEACFAIEAENRLLGIAGLTFAHDQVPELGYWLGESHWGQGYASEAARALVEAARAAGASALRSRALKENLGSRNVLRKAGFVEVGEEIEASHNLAGKLMVRMLLEFENR